MKALVFLFGVICYFAGVSGLLLMIVTSLGLLPFGLAEVSYTGAMQYVAAIGLIVLFVVQHTIMAGADFKAKLASVFPAATERMFFMLATGVFMWAIFLFWPNMPAVIWNVDNINLRYVLHGLNLFGWTYLLLASFAINHFELFGLQQSWFYLSGRTVGPVPFKENLMYKFDRHPIMTGVLIGIWATPEMHMDHLLFSILVTLYIVYGVNKEEAKLRMHLGQVYSDYSRRVKSLVPVFNKG